MSDTMRYWLSVACIEARKDHGRLQSHVAAGLDRNQSTITRFERAVGWPVDADLVVAAYADDLGVKPIDLWNRALELWRDEGDQPVLADLKARGPDGGTGGPVPSLDEIVPRRKAPGQARPAGGRSRTRRPKP